MKHHFFSIVNNKVLFCKNGAATLQCLDHNLIQQGYNILQETLFSHFILNIGRDPEEKKFRKIASQAATVYFKRLPKSEWKKPAADDEEITHAFLHFFNGQDKLVEVFRNLSTYRNDLNHAGYKQNPMNADKFKSRLLGLINKTRANIAGNKLTQVILIDQKLPK